MKKGKLDHPLPKVPNTVAPRFKGLCQALPIDVKPQLQAELEKSVNQARERAKTNPRINKRRLEDLADRKRFELEADKKGLTLMTQAGYNPWEAVRTLERLSSQMPADSNWKAESAGYPSAAQRSNALSRIIEEIKWTPPGTVDRRDFRMFVSSLRLAATY